MEKGNVSLKPLRLWPAIAVVVVAWFIKLVLPLVVLDTMAGFAGVIGGAVAGLLVLIWWLAFSRAPWRDRLLGLGLLVVSTLLTSLILHESLATAGQSILFYILLLTYFAPIFVGWAILCGKLADVPRRLTMAAAVMISCFGWVLIRTDGVTATGSQLAWRWSATAEEKMLAAAEGEGTAITSSSESEDVVIAWPGFRGPNRDSVVPGVQIATDWDASPPQEVWRRAVGPGWSSFAVRGDLIYTQEQRGEQEVVSAYRLDTGEPVWRHTDDIRFWESNAGAGPRATPTVHGDRVFAMGATGVLNALDARDGRLVWSRNVAEDTEKEIPIWGFSGSPLVVGDLVVTATAGRMAAYDLATGEQRWLGPDGGNGYGSPRLETIEGVPQVLLSCAEGIMSLYPENGSILWDQPMRGFPMVQPILAPDGDLLAGSDLEGTIRFSVKNGTEGVVKEEKWFSNRFKPNFSGFVVHEEHVYGFDGSIMASVDLAEGKRQWKGGRYGNGQLLLLPDQDLLLVITERGELALVSATPDAFNEIAKIPGIDGKTWNHPVIVDDLLLVRNANEMAAFRLPRP